MTKQVLRRSPSKRRLGLLFVTEETYAAEMKRQTVPLCQRCRTAPATVEGYDLCDTCFTRSRQEPLLALEGADEPGL